MLMCVYDRGDREENKWSNVCKNLTWKRQNTELEAKNHEFKDFFCFCGIWKITWMQSRTFKIYRRFTTQSALWKYIKKLFFLKNKSFLSLNQLRVFLMSKLYGPQEEVSKVVSWQVKLNVDVKSQPHSKQKRKDCVNIFISAMDDMKRLKSNVI